MYEADCSPDIQIITHEQVTCIVGSGARHWNAGTSLKGDKNTPSKKTARVFNSDNKCKDYKADNKPARIAAGCQSSPWQNNFGLHA